MVGVLVIGGGRGGGRGGFHSKPWCLVLTGSKGHEDTDNY